jgi:putative ABC transport system substrate-binding protein
MKRRELIALVGGAVASPLVARAQQPDRTRRIGVLMNFPSDASEGQARLAAFMQSLQKLGWNEGRLPIPEAWPRKPFLFRRRLTKQLEGCRPPVRPSESSQRHGS